MVAETQKDVVDFLSCRANFGGAPVERIDTHLSHLFLVGARVYKVKRALQYDFADFTTLERRRAACENEIRVNRRTAPGMYLGVVPIHRDATGIGWNACGEIIEWAVEMVRFGPGDQFDELLIKGELRETDIKKLADSISTFHLDADRLTVEHASARVARLITQLETAFIEGDQFDKARAENWATMARAKLESLGSFLDARGRHGWVRHCHGDLHLANICMFNGEPTLFDAIEFNDALAQTDVLYDLAFLLMDFAFHENKKFANLLLNRYLSATRDYAGSSLLPLFISIRAGIRAMVLSLPAQLPQSRRPAEKYFDLALNIINDEWAPRVIAIGGYSGTGKSTLARALALEFDHRVGAIVLRSDVIRKRLAGVSPETAISPELYTHSQADKVYRRLFRDARRALRTGRAVIMDATFLAGSLRLEAEALARDAGAPFTGVWLTAPRDILMNRVASRCPDASDATVEVVLNQIRKKVDVKGWRIVDAGDSPRSTLRKTLGVLSYDCP